MTHFSNLASLQGKICVVTGANRGIGLTVCETFLLHGATVIACVRDPNNFNHEPNENLHIVQLDLADEVTIKTTVKSIREISRSVDILVNCAGIASGGLFQMTSVSEMAHVFEVNVFNQVALSQNIARLMMRQKSGAIVNISSSTAHQIDSGTLTYGASKAALERVTLSMAAELAPLGIRVNAIAPGVTETDMAMQMDPKAKEALISRSLLKQAAKPEDIANSTLFLVSDLARHITGQVLNVDGGLL